MENFVADCIFIDSGPSRVFSALTDPEDLLVWMDAESATVAARVGGAFEVERPDGSTVRGSIAEIDPGTLLVVDDLWHEGGGLRRGPMQVRFQLEPRDGGVWLTVRQEGLDCPCRGEGESWHDFALRTRREWVRATVALKRHIEQI